MKLISKEVRDRANELQKDCHKHVEHVFENAKVSKVGLYQDATNIYIFMKLAELELKVEKANRRYPNHLLTLL